MAKKEMCPGYFLGIYMNEGLPKRVRCSDCGRRIGPSAKTADDGTLVVNVPPHKVREWYKLNKVSRKQKPSGRFR